MSPSTEAGRRTVIDLTIGYVSAPKGSWNECESVASMLVDAIEAEARAALLAELEAGVKAEHQRIRDHFGCGPDEHVGLPLAAVLDLIRKAGERER